MPNTFFCILELMKLAISEFNSLKASIFQGQLAYGEFRASLTAFFLSCQLVLRSSRGRLRPVSCSLL